jgi:hypothetical protein
MATDLYHRTIAFDYSVQDSQDLMREVWEGTPWMVDAFTGSMSDDRAPALWKDRATTAESALATANARIAGLEADNAQLRAHIGNIHNRVRHELSAEIEAATDKAFAAMNGIPAIRAALTGGEDAAP